MTIRWKTIISLATLLLGTNLLLLTLLVGQVRTGFGLVEKREAVQDLERVREAVDSQLAALSLKLSDWAMWDDTYQFMADHNKAYLDSNLVDTGFTLLKVNLIMYVKPNGEPFEVRTYDYEKEQPLALKEEFLRKYFGPGSDLIVHDAPEGGKQGIVFGEGYEPLLFASRPVTTSEGKGPIRGTLIFGAFLGAGLREQLGTLTKLSLSFRQTEDGSLPEDFRAAAASLVRDGDVHLTEASEREMSGYLRYFDPRGERSLLIKATLPREVHLQAGATLRSVALSLVGVSLVLVVAAALIMDRMVLRRVSSLDARLRAIANDFSFDQRVDDRGSDELSTLGKTINGLLAAVEQVMVTVSGRQPKP